MFTLDSDTQTVVGKDNASTQTTVTTVEESTETFKKEVQDVYTSTDDLEKVPLRIECTEDGDVADVAIEMTFFTIEAIQDDDKAILLYTGFPSHLYLMTCSNFLSPAVATLNYHSKDSEKELSFMGRHQSLTPVNEFSLHYVD